MSLLLLNLYPLSLSGVYHIPDIHCTRIALQIPIDYDREFPDPNTTLMNTRGYHRNVLAHSTDSQNWQNLCQIHPFQISLGQGLDSQVLLTQSPSHETTLTCQTPDSKNKQQTKTPIKESHAIQRSEPHDTKQSQLKGPLNHLPWRRHHHHHLRTTFHPLPLSFTTAVLGNNIRGGRDIDKRRTAGPNNIASVLSTPQKSLSVKTYVAGPCSSGRFII